MANNSTVSFSLRLQLGYRQVVIGQLDTGDSPELFISFSWWNSQSPSFRSPIVEVAIPSSPAHQESFCSLCGEKQAAKARFCSSCGTAVAKPTSSAGPATRPFRARVLAIAATIAAGQEAGSDTALALDELKEVVVRTARASLAELVVSEETREKLSASATSLEEWFHAERREVTQIVDGIIHQPTLKLSLALAQEISRKAQHSLEFTREEEEGLRILLTKAPFTYGYWSPFKKVLKSLSPTRYPAEFATAVARLSTPKYSRPSSTDQMLYEDLSLIRQFGEVGLPKTREYLRRHQLREYQKLADQDPGMFVRLATSYLLGKEQLPSGGDVIESFILMGGGVFRNRWSRWALSFSSDQAFTPPAASGWDEHPDFLMRLWTSVTKRAEFQSFAFQGLTARGAILSELTANQLGLALRSQFEPLVAYAAEEVIRRPETWKSQSDSAWFAVLSRADKQSKELLLEHAVFPLSAIQQVLELDDGELANKAISVFLERFPEWDEAKYSLRDSLWVQLLMKANASQAHLMFGRVFEVAAGEKYLSSHLQDAARGLSKVVEESWDKLPSAATLAYLLIKVAGSRGFTEPPVIALSRAVFVLALHRHDVDSNWTTALVSSVNVSTLARTLVLLNLEGEAAEEALGLELRGGALETMRALAQIIVREIDETNDWLKSPQLQHLWTELIADPEIAAGIYLLKLLPTEEHFNVAFKVVAERPELAEFGRACTLILKEADGTGVAAFRAFTVDREELWQAVNFEELINHSANLRRSIWDILGFSESETWLEQVVCSSKAASALLAELQPEDFGQLGESQTRVLIALVNRSGGLKKLPAPSALGVATAQSSELAQLGIRALRSQKILSEVWLQLVESELPIPVAEGFAALEAIKNKEELTDALLLAIDSSVRVVRERGLHLIDVLGGRVNRERLFMALRESRDPEVRKRVAEEALVATWANTPGTEVFDNQVLITRRRGRAAKELVKNRLDTLIPENYQPTPERIAVLRDLALHGKPRDAEWAQQRLAQLSLAGVDLDSINVSLISEEPSRG